MDGERTRTPEGLEVADELAEAVKTILEAGGQVRLGCCTGNRYWIGAISAEANGNGCFLVDLTQIGGPMRRTADLDDAAKALLDAARAPESVRKAVRG
jgi:hypothetical protein